MDYSKALNDLNPYLRRRLRTVATIAEMTDLEALTTIVEFAKDLIKPNTRLSLN